MRIQCLVIREDRDVEDALNAFQDFTVTYQADVHDERPIYHRRPAWQPKTLLTLKPRPLENLGYTL